MPRYKTFLFVDRISGLAIAQTQGQQPERNTFSKQEKETRISCSLYSAEATALRLSMFQHGYARAVLQLQNRGHSKTSVMSMEVTGQLMITTLG